MKAIILTLLIASVALAKELHFDVLETTQGKFTNVTVIPATANSVMVLYDGGAAGVPFTNLSPAIQKEFGFEPAKIPVVPSSSILKPETVQGTNTPQTRAIPTTPNERLLAFQLEMTNAYQRVLQIVNRPVKAYKRTKDMQVWKSSPGWFHEGAIEPDFNNVDVRQSQQLVYADHKYQTSDLNPGIVFMGSDLEFNAMTKIFYTNRSLPKCRLTEAEMLEINQLYRTIGRCRGEIERLPE